MRIRRFAFKSLLGIALCTSAGLSSAQGIGQLADSTVYENGFQPTYQRATADVLPPAPPVADLVDDVLEDEPLDPVAAEVPSIDEDHGASYDETVKWQEQYEEFARSHAAQADSECTREKCMEDADVPAEAPAPAAADEDYSYEYEGYIYAEEGLDYDEYGNPIFITPESDAEVADEVEAYDPYACGEEEAGPAVSEEAAEPVDFVVEEDYSIEDGIVSDEPAVDPQAELIDEAAAAEAAEVADMLAAEEAVAESTDEIALEEELPAESVADQYVEEAYDSWYTFDDAERQWYDEYAIEEPAASEPVSDELDLVVNEIEDSEARIRDMLSDTAHSEGQLVADELNAANDGLDPKDLPVPEDLAADFPSEDCFASEDEVCHEDVVLIEAETATPVASRFVSRHLEEDSRWLLESTAGAVSDVRDSISGLADSLRIIIEMQEALNAEAAVQAELVQDEAAEAAAIDAEIEAELEAAIEDNVVEAEALDLDQLESGDNEAPLDFEDDNLGL